MDVGRHSPIGLEASPSPPAPQQQDAALCQNQSGARQPLLMLRPQTSGIDVTALCFAKPTHHQKGFSLKTLTKQIPASIGNNHAKGEQAETRKHEDQLPMSKER